MSRARFVSLVGRESRFVAGLDGGAVPLDAREFDRSSPGGSSLTLAVLEQLEVERRRQVYISEIAAYISQNNVALLRGIFVDGLKPADVAELQSCTRQAVYLRLGGLCRRFDIIAGWWRERTHRESEPT